MNSFILFNATNDLIKRLTLNKGVAKLFLWRQETKNIVYQGLTQIKHKD